MGSQPQFTLPPEQVSFSGFLFDMDGTIIDSTPAIVKHWHTVGKEIGVSPETILQTSHGRRSIDVFKIIAPEKANWEYVKHVEGQLPLLHGDDVTEIPGSRSLLDSLIAQSSPWAIVTSGTEPLVTGWLNVLSLAIPQHLVTAESVQNGKPDPACYLMGLKKLGLQDAAGDVLVLEDAPAGIRAGKAVGCKVIGLVTSHTVEQVIAAEPDWVVKDLESVRVVGRADGKVTIEISNALQQ
ncbi:Glycerol-1-phosphate phosphohydrolase 2 [Tolypocladium ophioglossoides CBS 100239]|uniref:Glycerol-1-phosphate phosphohydrolase 2 n=1 Tax=Tolypocladium ophioglossoides (strain CBS 100239) TaxID=1163406 RepID=A0A0L0NMG1_TOLOC|nr:Glycerol-1-phosphate phosphohydrolase 2 [Tolypocladium ophioglossoides CBS 100239]